MEQRLADWRTAGRIELMGVERLPIRALHRRRSFWHALLLLLLLLLLLPHGDPNPTFPKSEKRAKLHAHRAHQRTPRRCRAACILGA
jgi:hypothetical protein